MPAYRTTERVFAQRVQRSNKEEDASHLAGRNGSMQRGIWWKEITTLAQDRKEWTREYNSSPTP